MITIRPMGSADIRPYDAAAPMSATVAIAVVSWNTREHLRACLVSLEPEVRAERATVTVVDNASADGSAALVSEQFPWAELIESPTNLGFGPAVNLVAQRTETPWIAAANADVVLTAGALEALLTAGARDPAAGIVAPRLFTPDGGTEHSVHPFPTLGFTLAFNLGLARMRGDRLMLEGSWDPQRERTVDWAVGAFLLIRRAAWDQIGGFDPAQWMYAEDLDLGWRAAAGGWHTLYAPAARVQHIGAAATAQAWGEGRRERWVQSTYAWMRRRRGPAVTRVYALLNTLGAVARLGLIAPLAAFKPERFGARRRDLQAWVRLHAHALGGGTETGSRP
jgi:N-acetylglucosaminyl-diphospho-decaprenol L-rhamnosyltransferase